MTHKEILKKAINKALNNDMPLSIITESTFCGLIFSSEFGEAFFPSTLMVNIEWNCNPSNNSAVKPRKESIPTWKYYQLQMLLSNDPILYLKKFI